MKKFFYIFLCLSLQNSLLFSQTPSPVSAPYCNGPYTTGQCNQTGPSNSQGNFINDFIDCIQTMGATTNINNCNSGCNGNPNNYVFYCQHYLQVTAGQTISITLQSGITFAQGFAIFVDWNQDNVFNVPAEYMAGSTTIPPPATSVTHTFTIPTNAAPGAYRMRVRCSYITLGPNITPCGSHTYGETEDYMIYIGPVPPTAAVVGLTATSNATVCAGQTLSFNVISTSTTSISYNWSGPGGFTNNAQSFIIANANPSITGVYTVIANTFCPAISTVTVKVVPYPQYSVSVSSKTICQGGNTYASVVFTAGAMGVSNYSYSWSPSPGGGVVNPNASNTPINPPLLPTNVTMAVVPYSVTVTPTALNCPITTTIGIKINNPLTPSLTMPAPLCNTVSAVSLSAAPGGGTWIASSPGVSPSGIVTPSLAAIGTNSVIYSVAAGTCVVSNTATFSVSQFNTSALTNSLGLACVVDAPINLMNIVQTTLTGAWSGGPFVNNNNFSPAGLASGNYTLTYNTVSTPIASVCPSSTNLVVQVFNPPSPTITPIAPRCNTAPTVALSASPSGGIWSQNPGVLSTGVLASSSCAIGTNSVLYTAGIGTCVASTQATFHISRFNTAALSGTIPNLCVKNNPVTLMSIVQSTTAGVWSGVNVAQGQAAGSYSFNPAGLPTNTYTLSYNTSSTPRAQLCPDSRTLAVSVLNPPVPSISQVGPFCTRDGAVQMNVSPANSGTWTVFSYLSASGLFTPSLAVAGGNVVQYVTGTSTCSARQTVTLSVEAFVPATITNQLPDFCNTSQAMNLLPITLSNGGIWTGPGIQGTSFNPAVAGAGTHIISYNTVSQPSGLCPDKDFVAVKVFSLAAPIIKPIGPFCNNSAPVKILVNPVGGIFDGNNNHAINFDGLFHPALAISGNNIISYSITSGPCIAFTQSTVEVEPFISAAFANPQPLSFCPTDRPVNMDAYVQNPGGQWSGPGIVNSRMFDPKRVNPASNNVVIYQTHSALYPLLCPDMSQVIVTVHPTPTLEISASAKQGCAPALIVFQAQSIGEGTLGKTSWYLGDGSEPHHETNTGHTFNLPGSYTPVVNYTSIKGCSTQATFNEPINIYPSPLADFVYEPSEITLANPVVNLINASKALPDNTYLWTIEGLGDQIREVNPQVNFPIDGKFKVTLQATSFNGCTSQAVKYLEVKNDFNVFIPASFTPNNDGINDVFFPVFSPYGLDTKTYELDIFDRWGHRLFHTNDPNTGWNGSVDNNKTTVLKQGEYIFLIKFKDMEGRVYSKSGNVLLFPN